MLVLSRKVGERLVIGDNITVVVSRVSGNRVTLAVEAPSEVRIVRGELKANLPASEQAASGEAVEHPADGADAPKVAGSRKAAAPKLTVNRLPNSLHQSV